MSRHLIHLSNVQRREVIWLAGTPIPRGMLSILAGHPGLGKSLWTVALAARVSHAGGHVIVCSAEDSLEHTIKPRLQAAGADTSCVHALVPQTTDGNDRGVTFPADAALLAEAIAEVKAILAIIDPVTAMLDPGVDSHRDASFRSALAPLHRVAEETTAALLAVYHLNKSQGSDPMMRSAGRSAGQDRHDRRCCSTVTPTTLRRIAAPVASSPTSRATSVRSSPHGYSKSHRRICRQHTANRASTQPGSSTSANPCTALVTSSQRTEPTEPPSPRPSSSYATNSPTASPSQRRQSAQPHATLASHHGHSTGPRNG